MEMYQVVLIFLFTAIMLGGFINPASANEKRASVAFDSDEYRNMISKSLLSQGNNKRLKDVIERAEKGEDITLAYIGGSITEGAGAKPINTHCYAYQSYLKFKEMFGKDGGNNIHFLKAGIGGTPSQLGVIRYERDVLRNGTVEPDIIIIEFAVNDADDETKGVSYESLVLKALSAKNNPAVILLFSVFETDWNLQSRLSPVGRHYDLPMVSVKDAVVPQFRLTSEQGNIITKKQFFDDPYHPTNNGHQVMADCLAFLFETTNQAVKDQEDIVLNKEPVIGNFFKDIRLLDRKNIREAATVEEGSFTQTDRDLQRTPIDTDLYGTPQFQNNWVRDPSSGDAGFKMTITSSSLVLIYKDTPNTKFGKAQIYVDGKLVRTADPHKNDWTHCNSMILYRENIVKEHEIEIKMSPGNDTKIFTILGFGYTL